MGYSYTWNGVHLKRGCENLTSVVRWIHWIFSALEGMNLVFTLMVSSTVMVDIVFARFIFCTFYWRWRNPTTIYFSSSLSTLIARRTSWGFEFVEWHGKSIYFPYLLLSFSSTKTTKCTKESWEDRRIHFVTSEEGTLFDIDRRSLVSFCLSMMMARATFWKAFRTGVANRSEGDIMNHVLVLEMFQQFSNTQTYLNKQTMSWCKDFLWGHVFLIAFVKVGRKMLTGDSASFCVKAWHTNKNIATWADISVLVCLVKVAELWEWLTWLRGRS